MHRTSGLLVPSVAGQSLDLVSLLPGDAHSSLDLTCFVYHFADSWERYQKSQKNSPVTSCWICE